MKKLILLSITMWTASIGAQDIHFSQVNMSQLQLNPANAGAEFGVRGIINYRSQWKSVSAPFTSTMASYDMNFKKNSRNTGYFAGGINLFSDNAGDAQMKQTQANLSIAYHVKEQTIGLGVQGGYFQRSANSGDLTWGSQHDGYEYDGAITSGESADAAFAFGVADFAAGLTYTYRNGERYATSNNQKLLIAGFSLQHLNKPQYAYQDIISDPLNMRMVGHLNGLIGLSNTSLTFQPALVYMQQGKLHEMLLGTNFIYKMKNASKYTGNLKGASFGIGAFYRMQDAFIATALMEVGNFTLGFSYDLNTSTLSSASKGNGAFEFSLRYVAPNPFGAKSNARFL